MNMATKKVEQGKGNNPPTNHMTVVVSLCFDSTTVLFSFYSTSGLFVEEKQFTQMLEMMISVPKWTLRPWKTTMESQLGSWTMYIPGVGSSNEMKEMKSFKDMIDAMTDEEIDHPLEKLNGTARERISRTTGKSTDDVTRLLFFFKQSLIVSTWLQERYYAMTSFL